jgi:uncharacterized protein YdiU (UPF0061 family)
MRRKFGLLDAHPEDVDLILAALDLLERERRDYTTFFRSLAGDTDGPDGLGVAFDGWLTRYRARRALDLDAAAVRSTMLAVNPAYVLRNHLAQAAIERAQAGDFSEIAQLSDVLRTPYDERPGCERYATRAPDGVPAIEVSCSS